MSDFVQQQNSICDFNSSNSWVKLNWVILSPIEQSIKRKIEAVGTPLKDWDIQINYGINTTNMCSHLQKKLFDEEVVCHHLWLAMQDDQELTTVVRFRQLHITRVILEWRK